MQGAHEDPDQGDETVTLTVSITVFGEAIAEDFDVPKGRARPRRLLPVVQALADTVVAESARRAAAHGTAESRVATRGIHRPALSTATTASARSSRRPWRTFAARGRAPVGYACAAMPQPLTFTPQDMVRYASVPDLTNIFALGCFERRVTVCSQQIRALNLVYSLFETDRLKSDMKLAVVGGGFAGLTVAAAAARKGAAVTLFEKQRELLPAQAGCAVRRIYPHLYDWPAKDSESADAPRMNRR